MEPRQLGHAAVETQIKVISHNGSIGGRRLPSQPVRVFAGQWSKIERQQHINELELRALCIGIRHLASLNEKQFGRFPFR